MIKKVWSTLVSPITMGVLLIIGALTMAVATFIENDLGAGQAKAMVYNARWFEALIVLFSINLIGSIFQRKLYRPKKLTIFVFHLAFIVMILGAGITRYFGYEGVMHIREGSVSNTIVAESQGLMVKALKGGKVYVNDWDAKKVNRTSGFKGKVKLDDESLKLDLKEYLPSAYQKAVETENGKPVIGFVLADEVYKGIGFIEYGNSKRFGNTIISFNTDEKDADISFALVNEKISISSKNSFIGADSISKNQDDVVIKQLYKNNSYSIVVHEFFKSAAITVVEAINTATGNSAYVFNVSYKNESKELIVWANEEESDDKNSLLIGGVEVSGHYGSRNITLPFQVQLDNFEIERYPGSHSPSSFSSYVQVLQPNKNPEPFHIYMNNILKMQGFRFYQSSYDNDEKGTILSVNSDMAGTTVTYIGYFLLFLGIVLSMFNKNSFLKNTSVTKVMLLLLVLGGITITTPLKAQTFNPSNIKGVDKKHADRFGELLIQDNKGRTEPVYTFSSDLIRKIARKENMYGLTPVQLVLDMSMNYEQWVNVPLIKVSNKEVQKAIGISGNYAAFSDLITSNGGYKLQDLVEEAFNKPPGKQTKFDKELIKVDERLNICYSLFTGTFLKLFPIQGSEDHKWHVSSDALKMVKNSADSAFLANILPVYFQQLQKSKTSGNYKQADEFLDGIIVYQNKYAGYELPSNLKVKAEVSYYKWNVFKKLFPAYVLLGVLFLFVLIFGIVRGKEMPGKLTKTIYGLFLIGFVIHTLGIALRWYVSGHAPMSNGYESLVFISWVIMLAGFIFSKQSVMSLPATSVLAGFALMVANLSFMDPEITNLVPVLKSYWLTIHVSVITGSYGFLGFGFLLGLINMILIITKNKSNQTRIDTAMETLTIINNRSLIVGLYLLTIGTFLGAVWANESWGRYWGWDPKETWSLITILVYSFVTHARMIPGMKGQFAYNTLAIYAFFSVLMTYFGVNYYLSGLHSYGSGDPIPVPIFVYVSVVSLIIISFVAKYKNDQHQKLLK